MNHTAPKIISFVVWVVNVTLGARLVLKLFAANPFSPFVDWVYGISDIFVAPFRGIFPAFIIDGSILETSALFAILIYSLLGYGLTKLFVSSQEPYVCDETTGVCKKTS
ncbi:MAG: YggT family protein [Candidatus Portnoybacteria bacterium]|nr:YggT family protein [Candidatus Portnoybacteria bacterium]